MASMMQQRSVWTKCFLLFLSPCKKNTKNRCEMFPCRYNSRVKILLIKFIECSYIWFHRVSEKYQKPLLLKSDPIGGQFGLFQLFWWCNKWIPEIQPAANNVYNNNALNKKKVSQPLTGLKASRCHDESHSPSAMSEQSELGGEALRCSELSAPLGLFRLTRWPSEEQQLLSCLSWIGEVLKLRSSWDGTLQSHGVTREDSEFVSTCRKFFISDTVSGKSSNSQDLLLQKLI